MTSSHNQQGERKGTFAVFEPDYYHAGCGEKLITTALTDRLGYKTTCPRHPDQEKYLATKKP
jgi:hypothetical protein